MHILKTLSLSFLTLLLSLVAISVFAGASFLRIAILKQVHHGCPSCELKIGTLALAPLFGHLAATDVKFVSDPASGTVVRFYIPKLEIQFNPSALFGAVLDIRKVEIFAPQVTVRERDESHPGVYPEFPPPGYATSALPPARGQEILIHDGRFTYELAILNKTARIEIRNIEAQSGGFVTRQSLLTKPYEHLIHLQANAKLEHSGTLFLNVLFDPFADKNRDQIEIDLREQHLAEANSFFSVTGGVELSGTLHHAHASMLLAESVLSGVLSVNYENLNFTFHSTPQRGWLKTWLLGAAQSIKRIKTRPTKSSSQDPKVQIFFVRKPHMPVTKWILKGLADATEKIISI